jgi:excisionase family DNA binding protein
MNETAKKTDPDSRMAVQLTVEELRQVVREEIRAMAAPPELYTPEELAGKLKLPLTWVYEQSRQGSLPTHRFGRYLRFDMQEVLRSQIYHKKKDTPS